MLRYKFYILISLLIFSYDVLTSQVIWRDSTGYISDTVYIDTTSFNLYGPFQYAKPVTASFLFLAPTVPNLAVPGWQDAIHNYQNKSFPYQSSPPYFNYNGTLYNPYDSRIFTDSLYSKLIGKLPENFLDGNVWIGAPVLNKPIYYRSSGGTGSVLKWKYAFFPYYKFPLYRNEDTVGVVFPDSLFYGGGISDSSVVADVIKINDTTLQVKRKAHIYNKGHYIRRTRLDSFLVSLSSSYYTYNNYYFDTTINNNYYNIDTNYYYNIYNIDTNYYIYNIDTNYYIYQIDTNIYITNNYYTANPDTFVTGIYAYMENDSLKIELTRSQGAPMLFTSVKLQINGMQKHSINDTTWHTDYPLNIWRGGTNYVSYQSNQNKLPSFFDFVNEQMRPSNTFATDMYVEKGINFIWRTNYGSWRMFGDYNNSNFRLLYDNEPGGITFWYNNPFQGYGISTNRYLVVNNGLIAGSMFAEDSCIGFTNGYWNRLVYKNDMTLNGVKPAKSFEDVVPLKQLYDSCIWRHGYTGTITSVSDFTICDDTIKMYLNDVTYFDGLIRNVSPRVKKVPACVKTNIPVPSDTASLGPESPTEPPDPPYNPSCKGSNVFSVECMGTIRIIQEYYVGLGYSNSAIRKNNTVYIKVKNLTENTYLGLENNDTLYMQVQTLDQGIAGDWYEIIPNRFKLAPNDSQIVTIILSDNANDYSYWVTENDGRIFRTMILKFLSLGDKDYYNNNPKPIICNSFGNAIKTIPLEGYTSYTYEQAPKREEIYLTHYRDCSEDRLYFGNRVITGYYFNYETEIKFEQDSISFVSPKLNMELSLKVWFKNEPSPRIVVINKGTIYDFYNPNIKYNLYNITKNDLKNIWSDFSEDKVVGYKAFFHCNVDTFINLGLPQYEFETAIKSNITYERKTIPFTRMYARSIENESYWNLTLTEKLRLTLDMKWEVYDVCNGTAPKVSDYDPGGIVGSPDTNTVVHDTLWIADRFAQHNILDTSSHKGISLNSTSSKDLPIWLYDGNGFIKSDYTVNDIITSSADTVISIVDTNIIATKFYVDSTISKTKTDSTKFATRFYVDSLFSKIDTTKIYSDSSLLVKVDSLILVVDTIKGLTYSNKNEIDSIGIIVDTLKNKSFSLPNGITGQVWKMLNDSTQGWGNDLQSTGTADSTTFATVFRTDTIKTNLRNEISTKLSKSDSNIYYYRPWKIENSFEPKINILPISKGGTGNIGFNDGKLIEYGWSEARGAYVLKSSQYSTGDFALSNHTHSGYLTSESDPIFTNSVAYNITSTNINNWNTAYSWGNHASAGYATQSWVGNNYSAIGHTHSGYLTSESDPVFTGSAAYGITTTNINNWNTAYGWGNHASAGYATQTWVGNNYSPLSHNHSNYAPTFTVNSPLTYSNNVIGINQAGSSSSGYLSSTDWNTFNNKASTGWVSSNFAPLSHSHDGTYLGLSGGTLSGPLYAPYLYMGGNLVATQSWVSGNYSPLGHTHSGYATESWVTNNFSSTSHNHSGVYEPAFSLLSLSKGGTNFDGWGGASNRAVVMYNSTYNRIQYSWVTVPDETGELATKGWVQGQGYITSGVTGSGSSGTLAIWNGSTSLTYNSNASTTGSITANGLYSTADVIAYYSSSDIRLKDSIKTLTNATEKLKEIRGVEFIWNKNDYRYGQKDIGVIAQELQKIIPTAVVDRGDGYLAVHLEKIVPLLIESNKELEQRISKLEELVKLLLEKTK